MWQHDLPKRRQYTASGMRCVTIKEQLSFSINAVGINQRHHQFCGLIYVKRRTDERDASRSMHQLNLLLDINMIFFQTSKTLTEKLESWCVAGESTDEMRSLFPRVHTLLLQYSSHYSERNFYIVLFRLIPSLVLIYIVDIINLVYGLFIVSNYFRSPTERSLASLFSSHSWNIVFPLYEKQMKSKFGIYFGGLNSDLLQFIKCMSATGFCCVVPCALTEIYFHFGEPCCLYSHDS